MKRFLVLLLTTVLVFAMVACGTQDATSTDSSQTAASTASLTSGTTAAATFDPNTKANISVYNWGTDSDVQIHNAAYARLKEKYPNITVTDNFVTNTASWSEYITKLLALIAAGNPPDMTMMAIEGAAQLANTGSMLDISKYIDNDPEAKPLIQDVSPKIIDAMKIDGKSLYFPNYWNGMVVFYNTKMFKDAGLSTPTGDWDWAQFRDAAIKLTKGTGKDKVYGFGLPAYSVFLNEFPYANGTSNLTPDNKGSNLTDPKVAESFQYINDLIYKDGAMPVPQQGVDVANLFAGGRIAMCIMAHNSVEQLVNSDLKDWDVTYAPLNDKQNGSYIFGVAGFGILKDSENPDACWEVIKELSSQNTMKDVAAAGVSLPISRTIANSPEALKNPANAKIFYGIIDKNIKCLPAPVNDSDFEEILSRYYYSMMSKQQNVESALAAADKELNASFAKIK
ncbi:MAG: ABC transporter substrate-binding protein [Ruminiclostridium sp.]